jgi:hypothetical protein
MEETKSIRHLAVFHLTKEIWITETVEEKDLTFEVNKIFMLPNSANQDNDSTFSSLVFIPTISKMYKGEERPYVIHHYHLADGMNLLENLNSVKHV